MAERKAVAIIVADGQNFGLTPEFGKTYEEQTSIRETRTSASSYTFARKMLAVRGISLGSVLEANGNEGGDGA